MLRGLSPCLCQQDDPLQRCMGREAGWQRSGALSASPSAPSSPGTAGSLGSEREMAAVNSPAASQKLILVHVETTPACESGGGCRRCGHPCRASASLVAVFVWVTPACRAHRRGGVGGWEWFGHGDVGTAWSGDLLSPAALGRDGDSDRDAAPARSIGLVLQM